MSAMPQAQFLKDLMKGPKAKAQAGKGKGQTLAPSPQQVQEKASALAASRRTNLKSARMAEEMYIKKILAMYRKLKTWEDVKFDIYRKMEANGNEQLSLTVSCEPIVGI
jgi:hypothetical protein